VARSYQYFGGHTFLVTVAQQKFYDAHSDFARWFYDQIVAMHALIKKNPDKVAHILQDDAGGAPSWRQFKQWEVNPAITWTTKPYGLMRTAGFMFKTQQLTRMPADWHDLVFPPVYPTNGG